MKLISMILLIITLVSCGKQNSSPSSSKDTRQEEQEGGRNSGRNGYVDANKVGETELLNVTGKVSTSISGDRISINSSLNIQEMGSRLSCSLTIKSGEIWHFRLTNSGMELELPDGTRQLLKAVGKGGEVIGSWVWTGNNGGIRIQRRYSFLSNSLIINQDCEQ